MPEHIPYPGRAWPITWEQDPRRDTCAHQWETVTIESRPGHVEELDRCSICHTPRCDRFDDYQTRCLERRHHDSLHIFESGTFEPLGGYLPREDDPR